MWAPQGLKSSMSWLVFMEESSFSELKYSFALTSFVMQNRCNRQSVEKWPILCSLAGCDLEREITLARIISRLRLTECVGLLSSKRFSVTCSEQEFLGVSSLLCKNKSDKPISNQKLASRLDFHASFGWFSWWTNITKRFTSKTYSHDFADWNIFREL